MLDVYINLSLINLLLSPLRDKTEKVIAKYDIQTRLPTGTVMTLCSNGTVGPSDSKKMLAKYKIKRHLHNKKLEHGCR